MLDLYRFLCVYLGMKKENNMKVWTKDEIKGLIETRDDAVIRGMLRIYDLQTESEQVFGDTHEHNGVFKNYVCNYNDCIATIYYFTITMIDIYTYSRRIL